MIYLKKITETQNIYIPRQTVLGSAYVETVKDYEDGYNEGFTKGREYQKDQLINLTVTENGEYSREDGYGIVTVDVPTEGGDCSEAYDKGFEDGYNQGQAECPEGGDLNIDAVSTSLGAGNWNSWTRVASDFGLDGMSEITIDGSQYQEWTKAYTLLQAYQNTEERYITENGEYRANIGYDGFALKGYNVGWVIDVIPTIDTDVEIWVKPYDGAPNSWQGFIGSQVSDDDNTTFQIRKVDGNNIFSFRFGEQSFEYGYENERWYRLRMNRNGVWVNGEQVCGWDVQAFEENSNPLMINGIYNLGFEGENYRMNYASYGYVYFHNTDSLLVPFQNGLFIGNNNQTIGRPAAEGATLQYEMGYYPKGYTKVTVDVPQNGGGSCNLEDKWVSPSMADRDDNGLIVVEEDEGYDGLSRVVIDPQTIYNEGVEEGRNQGGGGECNLGVLDVEATDPYYTIKYASDDGLDGYSEIIVRTENLINQEKENAINEFKNNMDEITITENGTYSIEDITHLTSIVFDGNSYFDTGIVPTEDVKIEACIKLTEGLDMGLGGTIIGGGIDSINNQTENRGISIGMGGGAIYGKWGALNSWNNPYDFVGTTTVVLQKTDDSFGWESEKGSFGAASLYIGGYNKNGEEVEDKFMQSIVYIKIWTDRNDDSTLITYVPNTNGNFDANGVELQKLGDGTTTFVEEYVNKYPNGFKRVEVNVDTQESYNQGFADATSFNKIAMEIETGVSKLEFLTDHSFVTTSGNNSPKSLMFDAPINYIWSYRDLSDGIAELRQNAFRSYGSIRKIKLNTIMTLGERAFKDAYNLQEIDMSGLIGYIATEVFDGCSKLAKIICRATGGVLLGSAPFNGLPENGVLYLTEGIDEAPWLEKLPSGWTVERL